MVLQKYASILIGMHINGHNYVMNFNQRGKLWSEQNIMANDINKFTMFGIMIIISGGFPVSLPGI